VLAEAWKLRAARFGSGRSTNPTGL